MDTEERKEEIEQGKENALPEENAEQPVPSETEGTEEQPAAEAEEQPASEEAGEQPSSEETEAPKDPEQAPAEDGGEKAPAGKKPVIRIAAISAAALAVIAGGYFLIRSLAGPKAAPILPEPTVSAAPSVTLPAGAQDPMEPIGKDSTFYDGISVDGISLGGLKMDEALEKITEAQNAKLSELDVTVKYGSETAVFSVTPDMVTSDAEAVLEEAMQIGRIGSEEDRVEKIAGLAADPVELTTEFTVDPSSLEPQVRALAESLTQEPVNARLVEFDASKEENERFVYEEGKNGVKVDADKLWEEVSGELTDRGDGVVEAVFEETFPEDTIESLQGQFALVTSFTTNLTREYNRNSNINLACSIINGLIMQPGDEFSFNRVVGERTSERGFRSAGVIVGGDRTESGLGGGICQVSGTLFNAVALADLEITERYTHSYELGYLKRGRDATVDYGHKDFCFKNNKDKPIIVVMTVDLNKLTVTAQIYGEPLPNNESIDIEVETTGYIGANSKVSYVPYSKQPRGTTTEVKARSGIRCTSYKIYKDADGNEIRRVKLFDDVYPAINAKIYYNPADGNPSESPSPSPSVEPTPTPAATDAPTAAPTEKPTAAPSGTVKPAETPAPTAVPTEKPAETPAPTPVPTEKPAETPAPTAAPTEKPAETPAPTAAPTEKPAETTAPQPEPDPDSGNGDE